MDHKTILTIGGIAMVGLVTTTSISSPCMKDGEVFLTPDVVIEQGIEKTCFELEEDYQVYKTFILKSIKDQDSFSDEFSFDDMVFVVTEETDRGNLDKNNFISEGGLDAEVNQLIIDEKIVRTPYKLKDRR